MIYSVIKIDGEELVNPLANLSISDQKEMQSKAENNEMGFGKHSDICAICLDEIVLQETAL
ncbi:hypothetical protein Patl1_29386 [Pistacia atlantica]|nr:hypothetical protein Patl1_29386 [Pistacia atlantica]